ncbi:hypothetical protein AVEN_176296-1 [Araneus ventricosus]|uniref:Uncharacterized protein n=1 Tax=Araneus ventricosus TaxID=182803 RepID=A0A4Y2HRS4_ARAVE|nr:hypothetical protein AVEN_176296-1 [Araneus ventricosus]
MPAPYDRRTQRLRKLLAEVETEDVTCCCGTLCSKPIHQDKVAPQRIGQNRFLIVPRPKTVEKAKTGETINERKSASTCLRNVQYAVHRFLLWAESAKQRVPQQIGVFQ